MGLSFLSASFQPVPKASLCLFAEWSNEYSCINKVQTGQKQTVLVNNRSSSEIISKISNYSFILWFLPLLNRSSVYNQCQLSLFNTAGHKFSLFWYKPILFSAQWRLQTDSEPGPHCHPPLGRPEPGQFRDTPPGVVSLLGCMGTVQNVKET